MRHIAVLSTAALLSLPLVIAGVSRAAPEAAPPAAVPPTADKPAAPAAAKSKVPGPPELAWKEMTDDQKTKYMKAVVTPKMKVAFQAFDGDKFKKFGCPTCHGKDPKASKFKMPSPDIHPLPATPEAFKAAMEKNASWPKWTKFMGETVKPQMAALLGLPEFDPKKADAGGFGCQNCHTIEK